MSVSTRAGSPARRRLGAAATGALAALVGLSLLPPAPARADDGPAPAPVELTVLGDVHTDAVSTFLDEGNAFALGSKADTPENGTRYDPADVWFHVDDDSQQVVPASGYDFIAPAGTQVWIAPESNPGGEELWPGFSTEGVPNNAIQGNTTTFALIDVRAPEGGSVEVFTGGGASAVTRRWSSDEDHKTFTLGRTHSHANWAFTRPGVYELDVRASVTLGGRPVSDTATYTFVVGDLPERQPTTTSLAVSAESITQGDELTLTAAVEPATVTGAVEFRRGTTVIGHEPLAEGEANLAVDDLPVGSHDITATFVPETTNLAGGSTSDPATVTVTEASGVPFSVAGVAASYTPGDSLTANAVGVTLADNQTLRWLIRPVGTTTTGTTLQTSTSTTLSLPLSIGDDGYEISAALRSTSPSAVVSQTSWVPIEVQSSIDAPTLTKTSPDIVYNGKFTTADISGPTLAENDTYRAVRRTATGGRWSAVANAVIEAGELRIPETSGAADFRYALQVVRSGLAVAQSEPIAQQTARRETQISGMRGVYRVGQQMDLTGTVFPADDNLSYRWVVLDAQSNVLHAQDLPVGTPPADIGLDYEPPLSTRFVQLYAYEQVADPTTVSGHRTVTAGYVLENVTMSDLPAGEQIFAFNNLAGHFHQGDTVELGLAVDPELSDGDTLTWEWKFPGAGSDWAPFPGASGLSHTLTAEQALAEVQVRATLDFAAEGREPIVAAPVTIHHDDHGGAPRQKPAVTGETAYVEGESLALSLELPVNGQTVLTEHRWERKAADSDEWSVIEGQTSVELTLPTTAEDDGATYRVSILKPNGEVAYGPSPAVAIAVEPADVGREVSIAPLAAHYHSGETITAEVVADPELTANDFVQWQWSFPGSNEWSYLPNCCAFVQELTAEQGLDGAQLRATLYDAEGMQVSEPVTVHVDDHGADPAQVPSVGGTTSFVAGESISLTRELPEGVTTVLPDHRWERRAAGAQGWTVVEGDTGAELTVAATLADDGAAYRVSVLTPAGEPAYGPSEPVTIDVAPETNTEFGLAGVEGSYAVGDVLRARVVGRDRTEGQTWRFFIRAVGSTGSGTTFYGDGYSHGDSDYEAWDAGRVRQTLDARFDGYEIRARLRENGVYVAGADTAWLPLDVDLTETPVTMSFPEGPHYGSDEIEIAYTGEVAEGDSVRVVHRSPGGVWSEAYYQTQSEGVVRYLEAWPSGTPTEFALQVVRDGVAVSLSEPVTRTILERELHVQGVQGVYRVGQTLSASAEQYPPIEGVTYSWHLSDSSHDSTLLKEGTGEDALSVEVPDLTTDLDGGSLSFQVTLDHPEHGTIYVANWSTELRVSDAAPDEQLLFFTSLSGHYHQGYDIDLEVVADPALEEGDTVTWEWRWPGEGQDWIPFPGPSGTAHHLIAEQALDNVQVRATVDFADEGEESMSAETTIHHDDHGGVARQQPTISGDLEVTDGESVTLTRELPENGATILTEHRWERKPAGSEEWKIVEGEAGAELSVPATLEDDGASYRVSILKPNGEVAYGPSPAVTLTVAEASDPVDPVDPPVVTPPVKVDPTVVVKTRKTVRRGGKAVVTVTVRAGGVIPTGKVRIKVAGKTVTVNLRANGKAKVKIRVPRSTRVGKKKVVVVYLGDARVQRDRERTTVRVTR